MSGATATTIYDFTAQALDGHEVPLAQFRGRVLLIVNTASKCGFTPQYKGLEALYETYRDRGLTVLGFPCDQFGHQEPGNAEEIGSFCERNYGVSFPLFAKIEVNGPGAHPLYKYLCAQKRGLLGSARVKWNFTKFLVDREGRVVTRFAPAKAPAALASQIEALL
jgi:glutathione peroxidase